MKNSIQTAKNYLFSHKRETVIGLILFLIVASLIALFIYNNLSRIVYKPTDACDLLTPSRAQDLLGKDVISVDTKGAVITGDLATSKCSYTDRIESQDQMKVAALAVRSGINDDGVAQNKADFAASKAGKEVIDVDHLSDDAYFNPVTGQLHILDGRRWIIISYGIGVSPQDNSVDDAIQVANTILDYPQFQLERF